MKLSELKGEKAVEVIADLIAPITNIAEDQKNLQLFHAEKREGETAREAGVRDFKEKIPNLLKTHKQDVLAILCAVNGANPEDLSLMDIFKGAIDLVNDQDFMSLFLSSVSTEDRKQLTESSADAEHSEPES